MTKLRKDSDTILDESGQRRNRQLLGRLLWLDRPHIKNAVCELSTHVGTATTRDEINIKRLLQICDWKSSMQHDRWLQS